MKGKSIYQLQQREFIFNKNENIRDWDFMMNTDMTEKL